MCYWVTLGDSVLLGYSGGECVIELLFMVF